MRNQMWPGKNFSQDKIEQFFVAFSTAPVSSFSYLQISFKLSATGEFTFNCSFIHFLLSTFPLSLECDFWSPTSPHALLHSFKHFFVASSPAAAANLINPIFHAQPNPFFFSLSQKAHYGAVDGSWNLKQSKLVWFPSRFLPLPLFHQLQASNGN